MDPAGALSGLVEVRRAEDVHVKQVEPVGIHLRADGLQDVEGQRVAGLEVRVQHTEAGVEPQSEAGEPCLGLEERVQVVEDDDGRVDRQRGPSAPCSSPATGVAAERTDSRRRPG